MTREECAASAQRALWPIVSSLQGAEDALDALLETFPKSPDKTLAADGPADFMLEVEGGLYFLLEDDLRPLIAKLKALATLSYSEAVWNREERRLRQVN